jgi:hypothetical protein
LRPDWRDVLYIEPIELVTGGEYCELSGSEKPFRPDSLRLSGDVD